MIRNFTCSLLLCAANALSAQTMGLLQYDPNYADGYILFSPQANTSTYLIDRCGLEVKQWSSAYTPGLMALLQPDGSLLRTANTSNAIFAAGGRGGRIERFDWNGNLTWAYDLSTDSLCQHHDLCVMPNGNLLVSLWDRRDSVDAVQHGKNPALANAEIWSERLLELEPIGTDSAAVVWEWRLWDHLVQDRDNALPGFAVVAEHPELVDINFFQGPPISFDWIHMNSIRYNADLDQVLVSSHSLDELWVIDHGTTTAEAAGHTGGARGHGGDLLYRWGNARSYDLGVLADQQLFGQHNATWLPAGHPYAGSILVFNNGLGRPGADYSSVDIITPPSDGNGNYTFTPGQAYGPAAAAWTWSMPTPTDLFAQNISGVQPVADGYLITDGPRGQAIQIDAAGDVQWSYINPVSQNGPMMQGATAQGNTVFRYAYYPPDFDGFIGVNLVPGDEIELNPMAPSLCLLSGLEEPQTNTFELFPNPASDAITIRLEAGEGPSTLALLDALGREQGRYAVNAEGAATLALDGLQAGPYVVAVHDTQGRTQARARFMKVD